MWRAGVFARSRGRNAANQSSFLHLLSQSPLVSSFESSPFRYKKIDSGKNLVSPRLRRCASCEIQYNKDDFLRFRRLILSGDNKDEHEVDIVKLSIVQFVLNHSKRDGKSVESRLDEIEGLFLNEELVLRLLEKIGKGWIHRENWILFFKWAWDKPEFSVTRRAVERWVTKLGDALPYGEPHALCEFVKLVGEKEKGVLTTNILNKVVCHLTKLETAKGALEMFDKFGEWGCVPDVKTYEHTIDALRRESVFRSVISCPGGRTNPWERTMLNVDLFSGDKKVGKIICSLLWWGEKSEEDAAHLVILLAKEKDTNPDVPSMEWLINFIFSEIFTVHKFETVEDFPKREKCSGLNHDRIEEAKKLLSNMIDTGLSPSYCVYETIVDALTRTGETGKVREMLKEMEDRGLEPKDDIWLLEAAKVLDEAVNKYSELTSPLTINWGYCKVEGLAPDVLWKVFNSNKKQGCTSARFKALDHWTTTEELMDKMPRVMWNNWGHLDGNLRVMLGTIEKLNKSDSKLCKLRLLRYSDEFQGA